MNTISLGLLWMVINSTAGIMYGLAFAGEHISMGNVLFYIGFAGSLIAYLWWVIRIWKKPIDFEQ